LSKFDLFVFDWDGTLSSVKVLRLLNEKLNPRWVYKKRHALETKRIKRNPNSKSTGLRILAPFVDISFMIMKPKLHNDSREVLEELRQKRKAIVLFTNGATYRVLPELKKLDIERYFKMILSAQEVGALKPNPAGLNIVLKKMGAKRAKTIYIGDMADDVLMAKYAKVASCAMACGFDSYSKLKSTNPDYIFRSMEEFRKAL
jgi:HAD superfamily hydrolase (TIGR01509 family)